TWAARAAQERVLLVACQSVWATQSPRRWPPSRPRNTIAAITGHRNPLGAGAVSTSWCTASCSCPRLALGLLITEAFKAGEPLFRGNAFRAAGRSAQDRICAGRLHGAAVRSSCSLRGIARQGEPSGT